MVSELGDTLLNLTSHEKRSATVQDFTVLELPAFFLPNLDVCLCKSQSSTPADFVHVFLITSEEVAVELLKDFLSLVAKLLNLKGRVIFLHFFDSFGALGVLHDKINCLSCTLYYGVVSCIYLVFKVSLEFVYFCS